MRSPSDTQLSFASSLSKGPFQCPFRQCSKSYKKINSLKVHLRNLQCGGDDYHLQGDGIWNTDDVRRLLHIQHRQSNPTIEQQKRKRKERNARYYSKNRTLHQYRHGILGKENQQIINPVELPANSGHSTVNGVHISSQGNSSVLMNLQPRCVNPLGVATGSVEESSPVDPMKSLSEQAIESLCSDIKNPELRYSEIGLY